jgi:asparagine synthetase B (glutamine-hydrolysing)
MCGIGGMRRFGSVPIDIDSIRMMLCKLENRGNDAAGIALHNEGSEDIQLWKDDTPAHQFVTSKQTEGFLEEYLKPETDIVLVHTRFATKGSPRKRQNNHPLYSGNTAVVHNGCISNDDFLFNSLSMERSAATDSDVIRAILDKFGINEKGAKTLCRLAGSAAFAAISKANPGKLMLGRSGNPLVMALDQDKHIFYWASEKQAIFEAARTWHKTEIGLYMHEGTPKLFWGVIPNDSYYILDSKGLSTHGELRIASYYRSEGGVDYSSGRVHTTFCDRQSRWDKEELEVGSESTTEVPETPGKLLLGKVKLPAKLFCMECRQPTDIPENLRESFRSELTCGNCKKSLWNAKDIEEAN